jgi:hypothetical protein
MPLLRTSHPFRRPVFLPNGHFETIYPALFRKINDLTYERERIETPDGDFLDLDWVDKGSRSLVVLTHGLEGDSSRQYVKGMAKIFAAKGWDVLAWNCRSCSGEMNRSLRMYHHGEIEDLDFVIQKALKTKDFERVALIGFSMGGNINMKYLGVKGKEKPAPVKCAVAFSSPTDLKAGAEVLDHPSNMIYRRRFLHYLSLKMEQKNRQYPGVIDVSKLRNIKVWKDFDEYFSAPLNGFVNADDFYRQASAKNFIAGITVPTLLVQAKNDPILPPACYPVELCEQHPKVYLEMPDHGGHCGFLQRKSPFAWSEERAWAFVERHS